MIKGFPANHNGMINGLNESTHPSLAKSTYLGISVTWLGSIIVLSTRMKKRSLPGKRNLAKAYATKEEDSKIPTKFMLVTNAEFL